MQQYIVNDLYAKETNKISVKEDNPNGPDGQNKEVVLSIEYNGRNMFYYVFQVCEHIVHASTGHSESVNGPSGVLGAKSVDALDDYYTSGAFEHYFRHLYTILKFIEHNHWLSEEE